MGRAEQGLAQAGCWPRQLLSEKAISYLRPPLVAKCLPKVRQSPIRGSGRMTRDSEVSGRLTVRIADNTLKAASGSPLRANGWWRAGRNAPLTRSQLHPLKRMNDKDDSTTPV
jgi:hypothetical protein